MKQGIILGAILIAVGIGLFAYYDHYVRYEREAGEILTEGKLIYERGSREAINDSINLFSKIIARYPGTRAEAEAYYYIAQSYEKLNLNRLAYLKYIYILKNNGNVDASLAREIRARIGRLKVMKRYNEEGIHELLGLLSNSDDRGFRSRVYTELGHTYLQMREYEKSRRMFDIALTENGDNEEAILGRARSYKHLGHTDLAYSTYEYYFKYYGNFSHYADDVKAAYLQQVYRSGHESYRAGKYSSAVSYFNRILRHFPDSERTESCLYWIGQSYFAMKKYGTAIDYFNRTLANYNAAKDEDARIRKGYAYFLMKKFDLAAREFQLYLNSYPGGRYSDTAQKWKSMSTQEMLYRIQNRMLPEEEEGEQQGGAAEDTSTRPMTGRSDSLRYEDAGYENVGEL